MKNEENMSGLKMDDFEQRLQRQPLRQVPTAWREEILAAAEAAGSPRLSTLESRPLSSWWRELLWPCPQAWAGLAAVWLVILAVNFSLRDETHTVARNSPPPSPELIMALRQQERLLTEMIGPRETPATERPKPFQPQPRSELQNEIRIA